MSLPEPEKKLLTCAMVPSGATQAIRRSSGDPVAAAQAVPPRFQLVIGVVQSPAKVLMSSANASTELPRQTRWFDETKKNIPTKAIKIISEPKRQNLVAGRKVG